MPTPSESQTISPQADGGEHLVAVPAQLTDTVASHLRNALQLIECAGDRRLYLLGRQNDCVLLPDELQAIKRRLQSALALSEPVRSPALYRVAGQILDAAIGWGAGWLDWSERTEDPDPTILESTVWSVVVNDRTDPERPRRIIDQDAIIDALETMARGGGAVNAAVNAEHTGLAVWALAGLNIARMFDGFAADTVLQMAYFGEVIHD